MWSAKDARSVPVKHWEIITDDLSNAGWAVIFDHEIGSVWSNGSTSEI